MSEYVELHARSAFSFLRGASLPEDLVKEAARLKLPGLALLDRDGVYGAPRLYQATRETGVRALVGAEITMEDGSVVPLLVLNQEGYRNLSRLISTAKLVPRSAAVIAGLAENSGVRRSSQARGGMSDVGAETRDAASARPDLGLFLPSEDPRARKRPCFATWQELSEHADGLIALSGDEDGPVLRAWRRGGAAAAEAALDRLHVLFGGDRLYVELQRRRRRGEDATVRFLVALAEAKRLPVIATGGIQYATRGARAIADVFTCLREHTTLDHAGRLLSANAERHLRSARAMRELFHDYPEAVANTVRLADRLNFTLKNLGYQFPDFPVGPGETMEGVLREHTYAGARERLKELTPKICQQLDQELALINKLGFAGYFLIVWDICRWCHERGILIQGRGSAANSAVCYCLRITSVNPVEYRLLFARFLSEGRIGADGHPSWPDIDLDLPSGDLRESVIQEIYRRYAPRGAAMVANVITYRGRSTARELGKVLGLPGDVLDRFSALYANGDFPHTLDLTQQVKLSGLPTSHPRLPAMLTLYQQLQGLPRHLGQHSGGMVFCPNQLDTVVPLENASMEGRQVVQWDKDDCEELGLVKVDFLGLGMMAVMQDSFELGMQRGRPIQLHTIPLDDPETFAMMQRADTIGVFQIESRAQMATLPRFKPVNFYDVAMEVAMVRPGPIAGRLTHPLIRRRAGLEDVDFIHPSVAEVVKPILRRTWGVILFQEQMLEIAMVLGDFTGSQAEELRRALGFTKGSDRLKKVIDKLERAMRGKGLEPEVIAKVLEATTSFAAYGFPESHAISFGLLAYASTWLKVHRLAEFYASLLNNQPMGFYSSATLIQDGRRHGLKVKSVCVQQSEWKCTVEADDTIRIGLLQVKGLHEARVRAMLKARVERPFASLDDFLARTTFTAGERRALASVGALQALALHRRAALWQVEAAWTEEESLFQPVSAVADGVVPLAPMSRTERMRADFQGLELTVGVHPMTLVRSRLPEVLRAADLALGRDGDRVKIAGSVICRQRPGTAKGFVFVSLEDETGIANAVVTPTLFEQLRMVINEEPALYIVGRLQIQAGVIHVKAEKIEALNLAELPKQASHDFR